MTNSYGVEGRPLGSSVTKITQIGRTALPQRSLERSHLILFYVALRLVTILLNDYTCLQLALQIWLWQVLIFTTVDLNWADVAWGCDALQRLGIIYGGKFISYLSHIHGYHCSWCIHEDSLAFHHYVIISPCNITT